MTQNDDMFKRIPDWWRGAAIYQIYPRSFQDSNGDGLGDLKGITRRLPHVASLGVDAIWISPFFTSPMADMGYDVSDYCDVDPLFGSLEDFDDLVAEAHRLGLYVIIDLVLSHTSDQHPWFVESRVNRDNAKTDWYVWADPKPDGTVPNNWLSIFGGSAWEWDSSRLQYYLHNFLAAQPDLNFHNEEVQQALLDAARFWLDRGVDGFRLDTVNFYFHDTQLRDNPPLPGDQVSDVPATNPYSYQDHLYDKTQPENVKFLQRFRSLLDEYDNRTTVGEVGDGLRSLKTVGTYTSGGDKLDMCYTFDLLSETFSADHFRKSVGDLEAAIGDGWVCWAFSNHDVQRHLSRWTDKGENPTQLAKFAIHLLSALRGSICLYQGEELALGEAELAFEDLQDPYGIRFWPGYKGRDGARTPMVWNAKAANGGFSEGKPWLPVPADHIEKAVSAQDVENDSVLSAYRGALQLRRHHAALVEGDITFIEAAPDLLVFKRASKAETILCVANFSHTVMQCSHPSLKDATMLQCHPGDSRLTSGETLSIAARSIAFLSVGS